MPPSSGRSNTMPDLKEELTPYLRGLRARTAAEGLYQGLAHRGEDLTRFHLGAQPAGAKRHRLCDSHGAGRADAGGNAEEAVGSCRDSAWLLVQICGIWAGRTLRFRLSDPAQGRREVTRRAHRAPTRISPICTPGPRSTCRAPAGSGSIRPPACSRAKAIFRSRRHPIAAKRGADHAAA